MKQKFSTIFILLLLFFAGSRVVAQNAPKPFDIEQPSLRVFLPAPELATGRAVVAPPFCQTLYVGLYPSVNS